MNYGVMPFTTMSDFESESDIELFESMRKRSFETSDVDYGLVSSECDPADTKAVSDDVGFQVVRGKRAGRVERRTEEKKSRRRRRRSIHSTISL